MSNFQVTLRDPARGNINQTIDPNSPPTLAELGRTVGGVFAQAGAQWYKHNSDSSVDSVSSTTVAEVGATYSASANIKAGSNSVL